MVFLFTDLSHFNAFFLNRNFSSVQMTWCSVINRYSLSNVSFFRHSINTIVELKSTEYHLVAFHFFSAKDILIFLHYDIAIIGACHPSPWQRPSLALHSIRPPTPREMYGLLAKGPPFQSSDKQILPHRKMMHFELEENQKMNTSIIRRNCWSGTWHRNLTQSGTDNMSNSTKFSFFSEKHRVLFITCEIIDSSS